VLTGLWSNKIRRWLTKLKKVAQNSPGRVLRRFPKFPPEFFGENADV
jgi:hypothetical protein